MTSIKLYFAKKKLSIVVWVFLLTINAVNSLKVDQVPVYSVASSITAVRILKIEAVTVQVFDNFPPK